MATLNVIGAVDMSATGAVDFDLPAGDGVDFFAWQTTSDFFVTFHSGLDDITTFGGAHPRHHAPHRYCQLGGFGDGSWQHQLYCDRVGF